MPGNNDKFRMEEYPLRLQFPEADGGWDVALRRKIDEQEIELLTLSTTGLAAAYGNALFVSSRLHHVLTDFAVAMSEESVPKILGMTSGQLRRNILEAAESESYAGVRPYLHGWDHFLGQQSIRYRNHIIHGQMWHQDGQDRIGRIEDGHYTELTEDRLIWLTAGICRSFRLLNQIFWDVLWRDHAGTNLIRLSNVHQFHARQTEFLKDLRSQLSFLESHVPHTSNSSAA